MGHLHEQIVGRFSQRLDRKLSRFVAVLHPSKSVGNRGDDRIGMVVCRSNQYAVLIGRTHSLKRERGKVNHLAGTAIFRIRSQRLNRSTTCLLIPQSPLTLSYPRADAERSDPSACCSSSNVSKTVNSFVIW